MRCSHIESIRIRNQTKVCIPQYTSQYRFPPKNGKNGLWSVPGIVTRILSQYRGCIVTRHNTIFLVWLRTRVIFFSQIIRLKKKIFFFFLQSRRTRVRVPCESKPLENWFAVQFSPNFRDPAKFSPQSVILWVVECKSGHFTIHVTTQLWGQFPPKTELWSLYCGMQTWALY